MSDQSTAPERVKRPRLAHDQTIALIQTIIDDRVQSRLPTMGTVVGMDGVRPIIAIDGETSAPRTVGFPARQGQEYAVGMRVALVKTLSGHFHIAGSVGGRADVVNTAQVRDAAINNAKIGSDVSGRITSAQSRADQGVSAANSAQSTANSAQSTANSAQSTATSAQSAASSAQSAANAAQSTANSAQSAASAAQSAATTAQAAADAANSKAFAADAHAQDVYNILSAQINDLKNRVRALGG